MDDHPGRNMAEITNYLCDLQISIDDIQNYVQFSGEGYRRNLLHEGTDYHALILCWKSGQRSRIHDHKGSNCGVKIIKGTAVETIFEIAPTKLIYPTKSEFAQEGDVISSESDDIHQMSNLEKGDLVTLHVYSPPLLNMNCYSLESDVVIREPQYNGGFEY